MKLPKDLNLQALPIATQYHLKQILDGDTGVQNVNQKRYVRSRKGKHEESFYLALAVSVYRLIEEYNEQAAAEQQQEEK
ncbi:hypothetical protein [Vibrio cholerae]|uniref:hypothetical protein n=1 Tax=Vibrio cholerae TaxID=666 RepID=UPI0006E52B23|nr:hypothetical protein [Vibrio cholerae]EJL6615468.1 hypothetical protein [Vibrio cholerae]KQA34791.1 hypothetical protein XV74_17695 [Vibrio cholerae]KQA40697.1 hypothetical protein XV75_17875 [Vibrio cholerae]KQA52845.1 hypothetical protein XV79_17775 [Vibrio cholerae]KQA73175.1 hypothetical protein XV84_13410 [Vibrio cholerae]